MFARWVGVGRSGKYAAVVCRKAQVARPISSESGGQCCRLSVDRLGINASAELAPTPKDDIFPVSSLVGVTFVGFQLRKAVQTLQGFPSGPRTIPGGNFLSGCFVEPSVPAVVDEDMVANDIAC